jgi:hypothetical protein
MIGHLFSNYKVLTSNSGIRKRKIVKMDIEVSVYNYSCAGVEGGGMNSKSLSRQDEDSMRKVNYKTKKARTYKE